MNLCIFRGNLSRDPEIRFTASNMAVVHLGIAINERVKQGDQWVDKAHFFDCVMFGKRGETFAQHHKKGDPALLTCHATLNQWEDQQGQKRRKVEFIVDDFEFIKPRSGSGSSDRAGQGVTPLAANAMATFRGAVPDDVDDLPF